MYVSVYICEKDKESVAFCSLVCCFVMLFSLYWTGVIFYVLVCTLGLCIQSLACASVLK